MRRATSAVVAVVVTAVGSAGCMATTPVASVSPAASSEALATSVVVAGASRGWAVASVTDGDTLVVVKDTTRLTVRLIGINTPESDECLGPQAAATLRALVQDGPLTLRRDVTDIDAYGRALRYVNNAAGRDVGAHLVRRGLAVSRRYGSDVARSDRYDRLEAKAKAAERGLWSADACGPASSATIQITGLRFDALGDDNVNRNDEWIQFTNVGRTSVDMTGWTVADESASNRFTFGRFVLGPGVTVTLFSGDGQPTATELYWDNRFAVWNNDGDTAFLRDRNGSLVATYAYGR